MQAEILYYCVANAKSWYIQSAFTMEGLFAINVVWLYINRLTPAIQMIAQISRALQSQLKSSTFYTQPVFNATHGNKSHRNIRTGFS